MKTVQVQCPAKINLNLKVIGKRDDGFHDIESVMQTIDLFDYLTISIIDYDKLEITLSGNSKEIPYDKSNLAYKAAELFFSENEKISTKKIHIHIEKNIPVSAGLAGGSTDAAGVLYGLNKLHDDILSEEELHILCAKLGSDLNFCLNGGCMMAMGRGEKLYKRMYRDYPVNLIKPIKLGISAKEAYSKFSQKLSGNKNIESRKDYKNDLEWALIDDYQELQYIKSKYKTSVMTGSGSTYFSLEEEFATESNYWVKNGLKTVSYGVRLM